MELPEPPPMSPPKRYKLIKKRESKRDGKIMKTRSGREVDLLESNIQMCQEYNIQLKKRVVDLEREVERLRDDLRNSNVVNVILHSSSNTVASVTNQTAAGCALYERMCNLPEMRAHDEIPVNQINALP